MGNDNNALAADETLDETEQPQAETATTTTTESDETSETTTAIKPSASIEELQEQIQRMNDAIKKANRQAKNNRFEADELKKTNTELAKFKEQTEAEKLSAEEKQELARKAIEKQLADAQLRESEIVQQLQEERNTRALERAGRSVGISDPVALDDAIGIAKQSAGLEHDEHGKPTNADEVMKHIIKARPWLLPQQTSKATPGTAGGATNPSRTTTNAIPESLSWDYITKIQADPKAFEALPRAQQLRITTWMNDPKNFTKQRQ